MNKRRILVVDDEPAVLRLLETALGEIAGHEVTVARDGTQALDMARRDRPDVVLLDIMMPGMDGLALCRALRAEAETREALVLVISGLAQDTDLQHAHAAGADGYLIKPFSPMALAAMLSGQATRGWGNTVPSYSHARVQLWPAREPRGLPVHQGLPAFA